MMAVVFTSGSLLAVGSFIVAVSALTCAISSLERFRRTGSIFANGSLFVIDSVFVIESRWVELSGGLLSGGR